MFFIYYGLKVIDFIINIYIYIIYIYIYKVILFESRINIGKKD